MFFNKIYFLFAVLLFGIETIIAIYFKGSFVRHVLGDYLVVILIYCLVQSITSFTKQKTAIAVLLFAYCVEIIQGLDLIELLGYKRTNFTDLTLGSTFDWGDLLAYTLGIVTVLIIEYKFNKISFIKKKE